MKKIMILGAGVYQFPLVQKAAEMCEVILVAPKISPEFEKCAKKCYYTDLREKEKILEIARKEKINGIITDQTDIPVRTVAYVASEMGLPGNPYDIACLFTDKGLMRKKMEEIGIKVLPNSQVVSEEQAVEFYESQGGDGNEFIIKPADNQGSRGVFKVYSAKDIRKYFSESVKHSPTNTVVIEKYATGQEFVVEGISFNGEYKPLIIGDTHYFDKDTTFAARERIFPSREKEELTERVLELNEKIITGFGLIQGISHSEYVMDGNDIYLIETAARGGGVFISSDLISLQTGLCTEEFLIHIALGEQKELPDLKPRNQVCGYIAFFLPEGEVISVDGVEEVCQLPYVHRNILYSIKQGMKIGAATDKTSRFSIIVSGKNWKEWETNVKHVQELLKIQVQKDGEIKTPIW